jgi:uncharacterized membrane-anchored protein YitT (DUF2179 family)
VTVIEPELDIKKHALWEDGLALLIGAFMLSWGLYLLHAIDGVAGGIAGVAFLGSYLTGLPLGALFFAINIPFYWLAIRRMGVRFTVKTLIAVALISVGTAIHPWYIDVSMLNPLYAAVFAGISVGVGMLVLFRHGASAGGFGILAAYAQERWNIRAGYLQGALDLVVVLGSLALVAPLILLCSIVGVAVLNLLIAINHRPGRYFG